MKRLAFSAADHLSPAAAAVADTVAAGGVVLLPTETYYGLAAAPGSRQGVDAIYALKGRPETMPLPVLCADWRQLEDLVEVPQRYRVRLSRTWPGPLTVILKCRRPLAAAPGHTLAVRIPGMALLRTLLYRAGPLTGTSANRHGRPPCVDPDAALSSLDGDPELVLDGGVTAGVAPSTLVDLSGDEARVLRPGGASWQ
jgi:L-threonylcarbamoyladenylate synthase